MVRGGGGGRSGPYFFSKIYSRGRFGFLLPFDSLHCTPNPITWCPSFGGGGGGTPAYLGGGKIKKICFGQGWDSGRAV